MNVLLKKAAAILTAGIMTAAGISAESFAESGRLSVSYNDLSLEAAVAKPTYTVKGSLGVRKIRLSCATPGATIYYTADGSTPTSKSKVYREGSFLKTTKDCVIRAVAIKGGVSSAVMKKTIKIKTMYGDVTGDGNINQNDYSRFRNYLNGNTTFICKDNADCNGSGGLSSKDLTVLEQYLNDRISSLPANPVTSVKRPGAVISKVMGGKSVTLSCSTSGADIYYTTNGAIPETSGIKYTSPFVLTENAVVKAVAVKSGDVSSLREFDVSVPKTSAVTSDKSTSTTYDANVQVKLSTTTPGASIFYTIDGSDPITSRTTAAYSSDKPISITKTTTVKAYARAKGYADSAVSTFNYNIKEGFTISGIVWDDTTSSATTANGIKSYDEPGIANIPVYLVTAGTKANEAPLRNVAKTYTDTNGKYSFTGLRTGTSYQVVFEYNYQKYRAYNTLVNNGNRALAYTNLPVLTIKNTGAYTTSINGDSLYNTANSYSAAVTNTGYTMYAITSNNYSAAASDVNFALISKNYGALRLSLDVTGYDTTNRTVKPGGKVKYTFTLTNESPMTINTLTGAKLAVYFPVAIFSDYNLGKTTSSVDTLQSTYNNKYAYFEFKNFTGNYGIAPGKSVSISLDCTVGALVNPNTPITCCAQLLEYGFEKSNYDYYSIPGNFVPGNEARERDEVVGPTITVSNASSGGDPSVVGSQVITILGGSQNIFNDTQEHKDAFVIKVTNCKTKNDILIVTDKGNTNSLTYTLREESFGNDLFVYFTIKPVSNDTHVLRVYLKGDNSKYVDLTSKIELPAAATP